MNARNTDRRTTRTEQNRRETNRTMGGVSHTNPLTGETFGESMVFDRGKTVVADGGDADAAEDDDAEDVARVADVDHTPREGAPDASEVYERGGEGVTDDDTPADSDAEGDDE
ncbi:MAG: hypothetical protein ABEH90_10680 [Halolamina sp.]